jgi:hypothetical protein
VAFKEKAVNGYPLARKWERDSVREETTLNGSSVIALPT